MVVAVATAAVATVSLTAVASVETLAEVGYGIFVLAFILLSEHH